MTKVNHFYNGVPVGSAGMGVVSWIRAAGGKVSGPFADVVGLEWERSLDEVDGVGGAGQTDLAAAAASARGVRVSVMLRQGT